MIDLKQYLELAIQGGYIDCSHDEEFDFIADALKELLWYRERDLISREDVKDMFCECCTPHEANIYKRLLRQIPKAEYRGEDNDNR